MEFLLSRRSRPAKTLGPGGPDRAGLIRLLTAAARSPDHGKLEPWRFVVIEGDARDRAAALAAERAEALALDEKTTAKAVSGFGQGDVIVAVISSPKPSEKIPLWEQQLSSGAACLALLNAALASGWGANWLTGPMAYDPTRCSGARYWAAATARRWLATSISAPRPWRRRSGRGRM
jgi:nitroreductase